VIQNKEQDIAFMKEVAETIFAASVNIAYGDQGLKDLVEITGVTSTIYKYIPLDVDYEVIVYKAAATSQELSNLVTKTTSRISDISSLASNTSKRMAIEIISASEIRVSFDELFDPLAVSNESVVYFFNKGVEQIFCKSTFVSLPQPSDAVSYFAFPTFKNLDAALERYKIYRARRSNCPILSTVWFDVTNRIFFKDAPEATLRKSLYDFLSHYVRGEVKEEQNVDDSKPVDIKITWDFASHIALLEVKWMGKSIVTLGQRKPNQTMNDAEAVAGAKQLADYLDRHKPYTATQFTKGYLVVFDGRRWQTNTSSTSVNHANGMYYENREVTYTIQHHATRLDFAEPVRFFIEPIITP
jgi:hypothetical protein